MNELSPEVVLNQCDGCRLGWPLNEHGNHVDKYGRPDMACQAYRYPSKSSVDTLMQRLRESLEKRGD